MHFSWKGFSFFHVLFFFFANTEIPELTESPVLTVRYNEVSTEAEFQCKFKKLERGDVTYTVEWLVDGRSVVTRPVTDDDDILSESLYGNGGYGVKVSL